MYAVSPLILLALVALAGGGWSAWRARAQGADPAIRSRPQLWGLLGAASAAVGAAVLLAPLNFCPFELDGDGNADQLNVLIGIFLLVAGAYLVHRVVMLLVGRWLRGEGLPGAGETRPGTFRGPAARLFALLCLAPTLTILAIFLYYPMFDTFQLSTQLARLGAPRTRFVCMRNFNQLLSDPDYGRTLLVSFFLAAFIVVFSLAFSLLIAQMAYRPITGGRIYRALLVWPYALSRVIAGIIFQLLFHNTAGVLNHILDTLFGFEVSWLLDPSIAPWTVIVASIWNILGFCILFYIAGLQNVPDDLLEAAAIDGASAWQRFFSITFPLLAPITFFLVVTTTTYAFFDTYGLIDFLTAGGPVESTTTMMYEVFEVGVVARNLGSAAARSLLLFGIVIGVTIVQFRFSRGRVMYGS